MDDPTTTTLGELVTETPAAARILERLNLDYCCGGQSTLADACSAAQIDPGDVLAEIAALEDRQDPAWGSMKPTELVDHLEATHHEYLTAELPRLSALAAKVEAVHGDRHPELGEVRSVFTVLRADLEPHLMKEERVLFPMIRELEVSETVPEFHCGTLQNPIRMMCHEHDQVGDLLARLSSLTGGYVAPDDACASYRVFYEGLAELEADTHLHIHKENNLLFPAVLDLENSMTEAANLSTT